MRAIRISAYATLALVTLLLAPACGRDDDDDEAGEEAEVATMTAAQPGQPVEITEETAGLFARATIKPEQARETALAAVPGGSLLKGELEEEDGTLIYSFDIKVAGVEGITEVHVDAGTGAVLKTEHEDEGKESDEGGR